MLSSLLKSYLVSTRGGVLLSVRAALDQIFVPAILPSLPVSDQISLLHICHNGSGHGAGSGNLGFLRSAMPPLQRVPTP